VRFDISPQILFKLIFLVESCDGGSSSLQCVTAVVDGTIYYVGAEPSDLKALIAAAIANGNFDSVPGWEGFAVVDQLTPPSSSPSPVPTSSPVSTTPAPNTVSGLTGQESYSSDSRLSAGGYVGVAVAGLAVAFLCLFASRHRRGTRSSEQVALKHRQFTHDDESDGANVSRGGDGDFDVEEASDRLAYVDGDEFSIISDLAAAEQLLYNSSKLADGQSLADHFCSSPNCVLCEQKRQRGVTFVPIQEPTHPSRLPLDAKRDYLSADTVIL
jgi:hypothetical protein